MRNQGAALRSPKGWGIWLVAAMVLAVVFLPAGAVGAQTELGCISGTVYDNASPPNPASVAAYPAAGDLCAGTAMSGVDGSYLIPDVPSGDYAWLSGWSNAHPAPVVTVTALYETAGVNFSLVATPGPGSISGRVVYPGGAALAGVSVVASSPSCFGPGVVSDADGYFSIVDLPYDTYTVYCPGRFAWEQPEDINWVLQIVSGVVLDAADPHAELLIQLESAGFISGTVTGPDGLPLGGIYIEAQADPWSPDGYSYGRTDADGHYRIGCMAGGQYEVYASFNPGYADEYYLDSHSCSGSTLVPVTVGEETAGIDFTLEPGGTISGRIVDLEGNPVYGVSVLFENPDILGIVIEASGAYSFSGFPYGTYTMTCPSGFWGPADGDWQQQVVTVALGPDTPDVVCDFFLAPAAPPLAITSFTADGVGLQPIGTTVRWTASSTGPAGRQYCFYVYHDGTRVYAGHYQTANFVDYFCGTAGVYQAKAFVRAPDGSTVWALSETLTIGEALSITSVTPDVSSPVPGTDVTWTCSTTGMPRWYAFTVYRDGTVVATVPYGMSNQVAYACTVAGSYRVKAFARSLTGEIATLLSANLVVAEPLAITALSADKASPQEVGATVTWTCEATGPAGRQYAFYLFCGSARVASASYGVSNSIESFLNSPGLYKVKAFVRAPDGTVVTSLSAGLTIVEALEPVTITSVTADMGSPQPAGTTVRWTCNDTGPAGLYHAFYVYKGSTRVAVQSYGLSNYIDYCCSAPGTYTVKAFVRNLDGTTVSALSDHMAIEAIE